MSKSCHNEIFFFSFYTDCTSHTKGYLPLLVFLLMHIKIKEATFISRFPFCYIKNVKYNPKDVYFLLKIQSKIKKTTCYKLPQMS